jgi:hypothetical protein
MGDDLDDIRIAADCPGCGATVSFTYGQAKLTNAVSCRCGALLRLDMRAISTAAVQPLIDKANPPDAAND